MSGGRLLDSTSGPLGVFDARGPFREAVGLPPDVLAGIMVT
jgi:hypothetical protein